MKPELSVEDLTKLVELIESLASQCKSQLSLKGLTKLVELIKSLSSQCRSQSRSNANMVSYLR